MSRHNRRRNRGGHKHHGMPLPLYTFDSPSRLFPIDTPSGFITGPSDPPFVIASSQSQPPSRRSSLAARHWHNRYLAWQVRERRQKDEREKLEAEKRRIFGGNGDDGEDDGLCVKMLEYFGGLDFIEG